METWAKREAPARPARVRLALRLLKAFLRWAAAEPDLKDRADPTAASAKKAREAAGKAKARDDYLQREQLAAWFKHVRAIGNPVITKNAARRARYHASTGTEAPEGDVSMGSASGRLVEPSIARRQAYLNLSI